MMMRLPIRCGMTVFLFPSFGGVADEGRRGGLLLVVGVLTNY
ncbi:MAG TPA: hypothetical protein PL128_08085 [Ginsengibacter sp.]|nr:hypothetical protein [Ginsengibacter sp.]